MTIVICSLFCLRTLVAHFANYMDPIWTAPLDASILAQDLNYIPSFLGAP